MGVTRMLKRIFSGIFHSLQNKIFIFTLLLVLIPLISLGLFSYVKSSETVQQEVVESDLNTVTQIGNNVKLMKDYVEDTSLFLIQNKVLRDYLKFTPSTPKNDINKQREEAELLLNQLLTEKSYIDSVYVEGFNGLHLDTKGSQKPLQQKTIHQLLGLHGKGTWASGGIGTSDGQPTKVLSHMRVIRDINNISNHFGVIKINLDMEAINRLYTNKKMKQGSFYLVNGQNKIVSTSGHLNPGSKLPAGIQNNERFKDTKRGHYTATLDGEKQAIMYDHLGTDGWKIVYKVPLQELNQKSFIPQTLMVIVIFSFVVCAWSAFLFSKRVVRPIKKLSQLMNRMEKEDFNGKINVRGMDEVARLGQSFNNMAQRLKELVHEVYTTRIKQKEAQLKALQSQINPHFLYNTLDTIYWNARIEKAFETSELVEAMSKLFRLSLSSGREMITVKDELSHLRYYMVIQQKRYEDMIDFQLQIDDHVLHAQTIKMVLQPLVENAIIHGLHEKEENGHIDVSVYLQGDDLIFKVTDDGVGVNPEEMERLLHEADEQQNRGFGIKNVNDRVQLYFGEQYGLTFMNRDKEGTIVFLKQPFKEMDHHDETHDR